MACVDGPELDPRMHSPVLYFFPRALSIGACMEYIANSTVSGYLPSPCLPGADTMFGLPCLGSREEEAPGYDRTHQPWALR